VHEIKEVQELEGIPRVRASKAQHADLRAW
jgi:hypothetical protein